MTLIIFHRSTYAYVQDTERHYSKHLPPGAGCRYPELTAASRYTLKPSEAFYDGHELNGNWLPTLGARGTLQDQHVMRFTPKYNRTGGIAGAVNDYTGETVGLCQRRKCSREVAA